MTKLKKIGLFILFSALGSGGTMVYNYFTGDIALPEFMAQIKTFAATIFTAAGSATGVILIAFELIKAKANEYKGTVDEMVANNQLSAELGNAINTTIDNSISKIENIALQQAEKVDETIENSRVLQEKNQDVLEAVNSFLENISNLLIEEVGD